MKSVAGAAEEQPACRRRRRPPRRRRVRHPAGRRRSRGTRRQPRPPRPAEHPPPARRARVIAAYRSQHRRRAGAASRPDPRAALRQRRHGALPRQVHGARRARRVHAGLGRRATRRPIRCVPSCRTRSSATSWSCTTSRSSICAKGKVSSFEALMRWKHPSRGMIPPSEFIPIAEETRLIVRMGSWALKQACTDAMDWPDDTKVAVNLSAVQIECCDVYEIVTDGPERTGPRAAASAAGDHRDGADARPDAHAGGAAQAARSRRPDHARRLRNLLCDAELPAQLPVQEDQDRPQLRARHSRASRLRRHRQIGRRSRTRAQHALGRRGRGDGGQPRRRARGRLRRGAGLLFQPAGARQRRQARGQAVHAAACRGRVRERRSAKAAHRTRSPDRAAARRRRRRGSSPRSACRSARSSAGRSSRPA